MSDENNFSRLRELALRGKEYRNVHEYEYLGEDIELSLGPLEDKVLIPVAGVLEAEFGMEDVDEASEEIDESRSEEGDIDPSSLDEEFVLLMARVGFHGIDTEEKDAAGMTDESLRQVLGIADDEDENIGLVNGFTLEIAQDVLDISSDSESAEKFRR